MENKINTYTCPNGHVTVTVDTDEGTTPMMLRCRQRASDGKHNCTEFAKSAFYQCDQSLTPEYEWYKPVSLKGLSNEMKEHVKMGGLEIRKLPVSVNNQSGDEIKFTLKQVLNIWEHGHILGRWECTPHNVRDNDNRPVSKSVYFKSMFNIDV
jgi:hypothetical protein